MDDAKRLHRTQIYFVLIACLINTLSYVLVICGGNLFQHYTISHHLPSDIYAKYSLMGFKIGLVIIALGLFTKFQQLNYQRVLISILILALLPLPVTLTTFPIINGFSNTINWLSQAWLQLYVPPALRATVSGVLTGLTGIINIRSTQVEKYWDFSVTHKHAISVILVVCLFFFWKFSLKLKNLQIDHKPLQENPETILNLIVKYPYIFIACIMLGFNQGIYYYTLIIATEALPKNPAEIYQYVIYAAAIITPMFMGGIADKLGLRLVILSSALLLTLCNFGNAILNLSDVNAPLPYYIIAFIESGITAGFWALTCALIGDVLRTKGIFRSFAISAITVNLGIIICGKIYAKFSSFSETMIAMGVFNFVFMLVLWHFYKAKHQKI